MPPLCWCRNKMWVLCACQWVERDLGMDVPWHSSDQSDGMGAVPGKGK